MSCLLLGVSAHAQVNDEIYGSLQFEFATPGARSLGMGNAFAGLADDATAAYANPAGLHWLQRPEIAAEIRHRSYETEYVDGGSFSGSPTGLGIDVHDRVLTGESTTSTTGLGFLSWVYPWKRFALAVYRHTAADYQGEIRGSQGAFLGPAANRFRIAPLRAQMSLELVDYGVSAAWRWTPSFWVGAGVSYFRIDLESISTAYDSFEVFDPASGHVQLDYDATSYPPDEVVNSNTQESSDGDFTGTLGWMWEHNGWSVGGFYRRGPTFDLDYRVAFGPAGIELAAASGLDPAVLEAALTGRAEFRVPHVWGLGASFRPTDSITLSAEVDRIEYSRLSPSANVQVSGIRLDDPIEDYRVDDGTEIHLGFEYVLFGKRSWAFRLGSWWDPDHSIRYEGEIERIQIRFPGDDDLLHATAGVGVAFDSGRWQADLALDYSERETIASMSAVFAY